MLNLPLCFSCLAIQIYTKLLQSLSKRRKNFNVFKKKLTLRLFACFSRLSFYVLGKTDLGKINLKFQ